MVQYITIQNDKGTIKLSALVVEHGDKVMTSIEFVVSPIEKYNRVWDNPNYIFGGFREYLKAFINRTRTTEQLEEFKETRGFIITTDDAKEVLDMLNLAEKQGWETEIHQATDVTPKLTKTWEI